MAETRRVGIPGRVFSAAEQVRASPGTSTWQTFLGLLRERQGGHRIRCRNPGCEEGGFVPVETSLLSRGESTRKARHRRGALWAKWCGRTGLPLSAGWAGRRRAGGVHPWGVKPDSPASKNGLLQTDTHAQELRQGMHLECFPSAKMVRCRSASQATHSCRRRTEGQGGRTC